jgi:tRNA threonylcarbamoyladenosine biosynthesis protein TsaE
MHHDHLTLPPCTLRLNDEAATLDLGRTLAAAVQPGCVIWLEGDLGAGKTTLVRGLLRAAGDAGPVKSPTYTLVEVHPVSGIYFYHFDFYRFNTPEEFLDAGLEEYFAKHGNTAGICLVEWPDKALPYLASPDLRITLRLDDSGGIEGGRYADLHSFTDTGNRCLAAATSSNSPPPA